MPTPLTSDSPTPLILYGAGGHAKSVISVLVETPGWQIEGVINIHPEARPTTILGFPVLGDDTALPALLASGVRHIHLCMGDNRARAEAALKLQAMGFELATVQHPSVKLCPFVQVGTGNFLHMNVLLGAEITTGQGCIIQPFSDIGHGSRIGDFVQLTPGVKTGGDCEFGDYAFVGLGAAILPRIRIGRHAIIGANAVVREDVPDNAVVVGNPGRIIRINADAAIA